MAYARIVHKWPDGSMEELQVGVDASYPDAVDEAVTGTLRIYREIFKSEPDTAPTVHDDE